MYTHLRVTWKKMRKGKQDANKHNKFRFVGAVYFLWNELDMTFSGAKYKP